MDVEKDIVSINPYQRVRVNMDIIKPLCRFQNIRRKEDRLIRVTFAYERLPFFYFMCGVIAYSERDCTFVDDRDHECSMGWGKSLWATPRRGVQRLVEEVEEIKSCRKFSFPNR